MLSHGDDDDENAGVYLWLAFGGMDALRGPASLAVLLGFLTCVDCVWRILSYSLPLVVGDDGGDASIVVAAYEEIGSI